MGDSRFPQLCRKGCRPSRMRCCFEFPMVLQNAYPPSSRVRSQTRRDKALDSTATDSSDCLEPVSLFLGSADLQTGDDKRTRYTRQVLSLAAVAMQLHHKYTECNLHISLHPSIIHFDSPPFLQFSILSSPPHLILYTPHNYFFHFIPVLFILTLHRSSNSLCSHLHHTLFYTPHTIISFTSSVSLCFHLHHALFYTPHIIISFTSSVSLLHFHTSTSFQRRVSANSKKRFLSVFCPTYYIKNLIQGRKENPSLCIRYNIVLQQCKLDVVNPEFYQLNKIVS